MARVSYSQKTKQLASKFALSDWQHIISERLEKKHRSLLDNWKNCAIGERVRLEERDLYSIKDLFPAAIKLDYDFTAAIQENDNQRILEIITMIKPLPAIWRDDC